MRIQDHIKRVEAFERAISKLDPHEDMQLFIWFLEKAGAHCLNAALHTWGITPEKPEGADAIEEPPADAEFEDAAFYHTMARAGDWIHSRYDPGLAELTEEAKILCENLFFIEEERADYVRGNKPMSDEMYQKFRNAYRIVRSYAPVSGESPL